MLHFPLRDVSLVLGAVDPGPHALGGAAGGALTVTAGKENLKQWTVERLSRNLRGSATVDFCDNCGTNINVQFADPGAKFTLMWPFNFRYHEWDDTPANYKKVPRHGFAELLRPLSHAHDNNRSVDAEDSLPKLADIWMEDTELMNNSGEIVGKVTFPMPRTYRHEQLAKL